MKLHRLIHVTPAYPPNLGGLEKVVRGLATSQHKLGLNVSVLTSDRGVNETIPEDDFVVTRLKHVIIANTTIMPRLLTELLRNGRDDLVHLHVTQAYAPEIVWLASKIKRFRYVAHLHLDVPQKGLMGILLEPYKSLILRRVFHNADMVIVPTSDYKNLITSKYSLSAQKIAVVPNATSHKISPTPKKIPDHKLNLLFVGRLSFQKNIPFLLQALAVYTKKYGKDFRFRIVGDGELKQQLQNEAIRLHLGDVVEFVGVLSGDALEDIYKKSDLFLLSSIRESFGVVLAEAMTKGMPIVSTNIPAVRDVVQNHRNGLLVRGNATAFAKAIHALAIDKQLYEKMSTNNIWDAKKYTWDIVCEELDKIYANIE